MDHDGETYLEIVSGIVFHLTSNSGVNLGPSGDV